MTGSLKLRGVISAVALVCLGLVLASPVRAADDGYENVFSSVLDTFGLTKKDAPPDIAYRERPPLVVPPKVDLPKPVAAGARRGAAWPQDPDVIRQRKATEEARAPVAFLGNNPNTLMSKEEQMKGRAAQEEPVRPNDCGVNGNARSCLLVSPDELKAESDRFNAQNPQSDETVVAGREPDRVYLTQPPRGYLKATQTLKATTEAPEVRPDAANPFNWLKPTPKEDE